MRLYRPKATVAGGAIIGVVSLVGLLAPLLVPYDPSALSGASFEEPSAAHLLGTNEIGQDLFSQLIWGAWEALIIAVGGALLATGVGTVVGAGAALLGGAVDSAIARVLEVFLAMPALPLMSVIAALAGPSRPLVLALIGMAGMPLIARTVRAQALTVGHRGFVAAARGIGAGPLYVLRRHMLPALGPVVVSRFLFWIPIAIFIEAGLAFLGLSDPLAVSWGATLNEAIRYNGLYLSSMWVWWVLPAGVAISFTVLGFTLVGIGLEPWFNPRIRRD